MNALHKCGCLVEWNFGKGSPIIHKAIVAEMAKFNCPWHGAERGAPQPNLSRNAVLFDPNTQMAAKLISSP